jgi:hypothetical protein
LKLLRALRFAPDIPGDAVRNWFLIVVVIAHFGGFSPASAGELAVPAQSEVRGMAFDVFIRLQQGMSEGELLLRAGKPDSQSVENMRNDIVKTYYYFPTASDPWITTIRLQGGRIANLERIKKF